MNKNKKLVALICAMTMIFSVFAGFTVVNAADDAKGIVIETTSSDASKAVITAKAVGFTKLDTYTISFAVPSNVSEAKNSKKIITGSEVEAITDGVYTYTVAGSATDVPADGVIAVIELTLSAPMAKNYVVELTGKSGLAFEKDKISLERNNMTTELTTTIPKYQDPNATAAPDPVTTRPPRVTPEPVATDDPDATVEPTKAPVTVVKGIDLELTSSDASKAVITAKAVGFTKLDTYTISFAVPSNVSEAKNSKKVITGSEVEAITDGIYTYTVAGSATDVPADGVIAVIELTLSAPMAEDYIVELTGKSGLAFEKDKVSLERNNMEADWVTIPVSGGSEVTPTPEPTPAGNVTVIDKIGADKLSSSLVAIPEVEVEKNGEKVSNYRVEISVTKDGSALDYGKDGFEFKIGDYSLTAAEYNNAILGGYVEDVKALGTKLGKTYNNLTDILADPDAKVAIYAAGAKADINLFRDKDTTKGDDEDAPDEIFVGGGSEEISSGRPVTTPAPKFTVKTKAGSKNETTSKSVTAADGTTVKVTAAYDKPVEGGMYKVAYNNEADKDYLALLTNAEVADGIFRFAVDKAGRSVKLVVSYVDGDKELAKSDLTIRTVTADDDDDDDDSDSDSSGNKGGGSIAYPGSSVNNNNQGKIAFKDLDTVPWAEDAILALVDKKVVNGRSETIFDPNGTVTRAEFAKMVVLGFNLTGGTASNFTDVATGDWFAPYVATGYNSGVISGYDDGTFRPNGLISRQEMAAMISRAIAAANKTAPATVEAVSFDDAWQIGSWAIDSVTTLQRAGIINGMTATTFEPLANATRAQAAVIINRAMTIAK